MCVEVEVGYVVAEGEEVGFAAALWCVLVKRMGIVGGGKGDIPAVQEE